MTWSWFRRSAYPTYEVGRSAGRRHRRPRRLADRARADAPGPAGLGQLARQPDRPGAARGRTCARWSTGPGERGAVVASDECYLPLGWDGRAGVGPVPQVCGGRLRRRAGGALAVQAVQPGRLPGRVRRRRPGARRRAARGPQARRADRAGAGAGRHGGRAGATTRTPRSSGSRTAPGGELLAAAFAGAGFTVEHSEAGLYLWVTRGEDCWQTVDWLAERGILVAAGRLLRPDRRPPRPGRADRDRRAHRRRRHPPQRLSLVKLRKVPFLTFSV